MNKVRNIILLLGITCKLQAQILIDLPDRPKNLRVRWLATTVGQENCEKIASKMKISQGLWGSGIFQEAVCVDEVDATLAADDWTLVVSQTNVEMVFSLSQGGIERSQVSIPNLKTLPPLFELPEFSDALALRLIAPLPYHGFLANIADIRKQKNFEVRGFNRADNSEYHIKHLKPPLRIEFFYLDNIAREESFLTKDIGFARLSRSSREALSGGDFWIMPLTWVTNFRSFAGVLPFHAIWFRFSEDKLSNLLDVELKELKKASIAFEREKSLPAKKYNALFEVQVLYGRQILAGSSLLKKTSQLGLLVASTPKGYLRGFSLELESIPESVLMENGIEQNIQSKKMAIRFLKTWDIKALGFSQFGIVSKLGRWSFKTTFPSDPTDVDTLVKIDLRNLTMLGFSANLNRSRRRSTLRLWNGYDSAFQSYALHKSLVSSIQFGFDYSWFAGPGSEADLSPFGTRIIAFYTYSQTTAKRKLDASPTNIIKFSTGYLGVGVGTRF